MFLVGDLTKDYNLGTACQTTLRNCSKEVREEPRYRGIFAENKTKAHVIKQKDYAITKARHLKLMFLCFSTREDTESGVVEIIPMMCILTF